MMSPNDLFGEINNEINSFGLTYGLCGTSHSVHISAPVLKKERLRTKKKEYKDML